MENTTALVSFQDMERGARAIAASNLFGLKTPEQALALMLVAQAEGYPAALAARDYHVIQGRPSLKSDAMLARFQQAGGKVQWKTYTDSKVSAEFSHPQGGTIDVDWSMERAKAAGLAGKDNWRNYPRQMLRARVVSEGIRTVYPACVCGVYTPEEVEDMPPVKEPPRTVRHAEAEVVDTPPVPAAAPAPAQVPVTGTVAPHQFDDMDGTAIGGIVKGLLEARPRGIDWEPFKTSLIEKYKGKLSVVFKLHGKEIESDVAAGKYDDADGATGDLKDEKLPF